MRMCSSSTVRGRCFRGMLTPFHPSMNPGARVPRYRFKSLRCPHIRIARKRLVRSLSQSVQPTHAVLARDRRADGAVPAG